MDELEATHAVYNRIRKFESENVAARIFSYLLLQHCNQDWIRFAFGPDNLIQNLIHKTKIELGLNTEFRVSPPILSSINPSSISDLTYRVPNPFWESQVNEAQQLNNSVLVPVGYPDSRPEDFVLPNRTHFMALEDPLERVNSGIPNLLNDYQYSEPMFVKSRVKVCHYFTKGFCKHGSNCRYFHGQTLPDSLFPACSHNSIEVANDDQSFEPDSLERLEEEIMELVKSRRGNPVSIASLPLLYYEKYGKILRAEGYLTESQRHGKTGYSLTRLLARMRDSISVIDRPHGQHAVILAEDAPKFVENRVEKNDPGPIVSGSCQIYLTFPAESTFSEEDVSNYFNSTFGPVQEVRIPWQQKRMFGFVTFFSADTVRMVFSKGNPHYVCGARVLVKPYREKSKLIERKHLGKLEPPVYYDSHYSDMDSEFSSRWGSSRMLRKQFVEDPKLALELQTRRFSEMSLAKRNLSNQSCFDDSLDELNASQAHSKFSSAEGFNYLLDVLNSGSTGDDNPKQADSTRTDEESSEEPDLPESPFAYQFSLARRI